jgi:hypothetical protein
VFLFDDFLGSNFLGQKLKNNEEKKIVKFIEKVTASDDKVLILTTREYILKQAEIQYDIFNNPSLEVAKCIIDVSHYTKLVKAKILYNHLYFSNISKAQIENLLTDGNYRYIINHRNYSPRVIQAFTNPEILANIKPKDFMKRIKESLDYPDSIWRHVFESQISSLSKLILSNLMTVGTPILLEDLKKLIQTFAKTFSNKYSISYSEFDFRKSIKELENTFIITQIDKFGELAVYYKNPSVQDFLVNYHKNYPDVVQDIFASSIFFDQLFNVISIDEKSSNNNNRIYISGELKDTWKKKLLSDFHNLISSKIFQAFDNDSDKFYWFRRSFSDYSKLTQMIQVFKNSSDQDVQTFIRSTFSKMLIPERLNSFDFDEYIKLVKNYKNEFEFNGEELLRKVFSNITYLDQVSVFERLESVFPKEFTEFSDQPIFVNRVTELIDKEVKGIANDRLSSVLESIETLGDKYNLDADENVTLLRDKIAVLEEQADSYEWDADNIETKGFDVADEERIIKDMFESLK